METLQISIVIAWYCASAMLIMAMCYGVYMELTQSEKNAIAQVAQLRDYLNGLKRANEIYAQGIAEIIQAKPEVDPKLLALMREVYREIQEESKK